MCIQSIAHGGYAFALEFSLPSVNGLLLQLAATYYSKTLDRGFVQHAARLQIIPNKSFAHTVCFLSVILNELHFLGCNHQRGDSHLVNYG